MRALFISDCHLNEDQPETVACFKRFLKNEAVHADALYILGDLFEYWIGDDNNAPFPTMICASLKTLSKRTPIAFLCGNRDFIISTVFGERAGVRLLPEEHKITLDGVDILLMHGDSLCTDDHANQRFRRIIQHPLTQRLCYALPLSWRQRLASSLRQKSHIANQRKSPKIMDVNAHAVTKVMLKHRVNWLIHGHTHRRCEHTINLENGAQGRRIVLGAWHPYSQQLGNALVIDNRRIEWLELN